MIDAPTAAVSSDALPGPAWLSSRVSVEDAIRVAIAEFPQARNDTELSRVPISASGGAQAPARVTRERDDPAVAKLAPRRVEIAAQNTGRWVRCRQTATDGLQGLDLHPPVRRVGNITHDLHRPAGRVGSGAHRRLRPRHRKTPSQTSPSGAREASITPVGRRAAGARGSGAGWRSRLAGPSSRLPTSACCDSRTTPSSGGGIRTRDLRVMTRRGRASVAGCVAQIAWDGRSARFAPNLALRTPILA